MPVVAPIDFYNGSQTSKYLNPNKFISIESRRTTRELSNIQNLHHKIVKNEDLDNKNLYTV